MILAILCGTASRGQPAAPVAIPAPALAPATAPADPPAFHLYLLMGQSNMVGRDTRGLDAQVDDPRVLALDAGDRWVVARDPIHAKVGRIDPGIGPGVPFARAMLEADPMVTIGLVPCAVGGTPLRRWVKGGDLYEEAVRRARVARRAGVIKGVLWHQGESDTSDQEDAATYEARLTRMFEDLRSDLALPDLPIVVGQLGPFLAPEKYPHVETVRAALRHIPAVLPRVGYADSAGLGHKGDDLHFSADAAAELGRRYARAMQELENGEADIPADPPAILEGVQKVEKHGASGGRGRPDRVADPAQDAPPGSRPPPSNHTSGALVDVWPEGRMPGRGAPGPERERSPERTDAIRITDISRPTLTVFPAAARNAPAPAVIVCPGGGYGYVVYDKEGTDVAAWLNSIGIGALVLKYRVPDNREGALQDIQRSVSLARARAVEWNLDPRRLGVMGFSAGGNLCAKASTRFGARSYAALDAVDAQSCRPDFAILVYPANLDRDGKVAPDLDLAADIPPTLIVHTEDDEKFVAGSKLYHAALDAAKVPNEFLLYPTGGHGYGLRSDKDAGAWPEHARAWLGRIGIH